MLPLIVGILLFGAGELSLYSTVQDGQPNSLGHRIALSLEEADLTDIAPEQFETVSANGIDFLHFSHSEQLQGISITPFFLIYQAPVKYPTADQIERQLPQITSGILAEIRSLSDRYPGKITSVGLFKYPNELHPGFESLISAMGDSIRENLDVPIFFQSALQYTPSQTRGVDFRVHTDLEKYPVENKNAVYFQPSVNTSESLVRLEKLVVETLQCQESILIIPANWYFEHIAPNSDFDVIFRSYRSGEHIPFPIPHEEESPPAVNWNVIFLFVIFGSILIHARMQPAYLPSLSRYFFNHSFYLQDVLEHRIRNMIPGIVILLQHALTTGVIFYLSAEMLFNPIGLEVLSHHFSAILWTSNPYLSLFIFGFTLAIVLQVISVLWLHLPNKQLQFLSQTLNLYTWPLHINFIVAAVFIVLYGSNPNDTLIASILASYLFVWFMSFNMAALDASKYLERLKLVYVLVTVGLHLLLFGYLFWVTFYVPAIYEPIQMALTFSGH